jgi:hypothetical protein
MALRPRRPLAWAVLRRGTMCRLVVVVAAFGVLSSSVATAAEEWGGGPSGTQAADVEAPNAPPDGSRAGFRAPPRPPRRPDLPLERQTAVYVTSGIGTPVGFFGLEAVHRFGPHFELAGGLGLGDSATESAKNAPLTRTWQWSLMPRARFGRTDYNAVTLGVGVSGGQYGGVPGCFPFCDDGDGDSSSPYPTAYTLWTNVEIGGEHWTRAGFAIRYFVGYATGTIVGSGVDAVMVKPLSFPYTGVGIGYAF